MMTQPDKSKTILVAPLDWGLGHATRDIPIINLLLDKGYQVLIGGEGRSLALLREEYPHVDSLELPAYSIQYPASGSMAVAMLRQMPSLYRAASSERAILNTLIETGHVHGVVSDNRFGLYSPRISSVYITHQVRILGSKNLRWIEPALHRFHKMVMDNFSELWIPDYEGEPNFSGILSHSYYVPHHAQYIGPLSRFKELTLEYSAPEVDVLAVLSGPEPQRTLFEEKITTQAQQTDLRCVIVRGVTETSERRELSRNVRVVDHLMSNELQKVISNARIVLTRPGYSTIMDLAKLRKNGIFVPTPGQTEQEYLGENLARFGMNVVMSQDEFDLRQAWEECLKLPEYLPGTSVASVLEARIDKLFG